MHMYYPLPKSCKNYEFKQGCQLSRLDTISHALTPSMLNLPHECKTSRQACKISGIKEKNNLFFCLFAFHFFLKLKPIHNLTEADAKKLGLQNIKILFFFSCFGYSRQAILKSWQPCVSEISPERFFVFFSLYEINICVGHRFSLPVSS